MSPSVAGVYGAIRDATVAVTGDRITWIGHTSEAPPGLIQAAATKVDLQGGWVTPGLIDAHTHLVFGGNRAAEFEQRLGGATYEEIARAGGGILSTVGATREASAESLLEAALVRTTAMVDHGVTTLEVKSGYGLDVETEMTMLRVGRSLAEPSGVTVSTTLLGAHALPPEFSSDRNGYLDLVCREMIPEAARLGLADAVDAFCEGIAFSTEECGRVLAVAEEHGLGRRLHADQLSDLGGAALAAEHGARSADHLEYTSREGAEAMAAAGTAAVLLPGAFYFLRETQMPPIAHLRGAGVPLVVGSDLNPGSSPVGSPLIALGMACVLFGLRPEEALAGMTRNAAPVLGFSDRGVLEVGMRADLACWRVSTPAELCYWIGENPTSAVIAGGARIR